jgi:hypothetical protein
MSRLQQLLRQIGPVAVVGVLIGSLVLTWAGFDFIQRAVILIVASIVAQVVVWTIDSMQ